MLLLLFGQSACAGQAAVEDAPATATSAATAVAAPPVESTPAPSPNGGANADVTFVEARQDAGGTWSFAVTVAHPDQGWEDYADGWDVVLPDGSVVKPEPDSPFTRLLLHPHETEQPFTRSQAA